MSGSGAEDVDVLVVGGGLAGLTCAMGLRGSGLRVVLLEQDRLLGGRARSWTDATTGDPVSIGPHIFMTKYTNMLALLEQLGTAHKVVWQPDKFITLVEGRKRMDFTMSPLPAPFHFMPSSAVDERVTKRDIVSNLRVSLLALRMSEEDVLELDPLNASAFLRSMGVTQGTIDRFWSFIAMSILNVPLEVCSAGALLRFYRYLIGYNDYCIGFPDGGLGDVFAPAAQRELEAAGVEVRTGVRVRRFTGGPAAVSGVELDDGRRLRARRTVAALPPHALRRLALPAWIDAHPTFQDLVHFLPCPYVSVQLWFDRKLTDLKFWARVHAPNDLNCDFYDLSNITTGWRARPSVISSNIIYSHRAADLDDEEVVRATVRELAEFLPEAARAELQHSVVNRVPMAIHCPFPGMENRRPDLRSSVSGLLLAGDWVRTGLPSSMESAVRAGWLAAEGVLADLAQPKRLALAPAEPDGIPGLLRRTVNLMPHRVIGRVLRKAG